MHKPAISPLVWAILYPQPRSGDPATLQAHISRYIVPEVQEETLRYYGPDGGLEAQYPGLDYTDPRHRKRLSWFPHHKRLFQAFDELRLASSEIKNLCRWEGTLHLKEKFEREAGTLIPDSAWPYGDPPPARTPTACWTDHGTAQSIPTLLFASSEALPFPDSHQLDQRQTVMGEDDIEDNIDEREPITNEEREDDETTSNVSSEDDTLSYSVGVELNQRLLAATAARARGEEVVLDPDWEQWLKEAAERDADAARPPFLLDRSHDTSPPQGSSNSQTGWTNEISGVFRNGPANTGSAGPVSVRALMPPPPPYVNSEPQVGTVV